MNAAPFGVSYRGVRVAVLGATGFIGRWVARALTREGAALSCLARDRNRYAAVSARYGIEGTLYEVDLTDLDQVRDLLARLRPSVVFNLAGYGVDRADREEERFHLLNCDLVRALGESVLALDDDPWPGARLVHLGSALEYGAIGGDLSEGSAPHPTTLYGVTKLAGTSALVELGYARGLRATTARLFTVYGPGEHRDRLLPSLIRAAEEGGRLDLTSGTQRRDFTYVEDVAEGIMRLGVTSLDVGEVVNLATGKLLSVKDFAVTAARILHIPDANLAFGSLPTRPEEMAHTEVSIDRLRRLTGWSPPTPVPEGILQTVTLHRARPDHRTLGS